MDLLAKKIKAREFVKDLRGGMDDEGLMSKYSLSRDQFHKLLRMAVDSELISEDELYSRISHSKTAITRAFVEMQGAVRELSSVTAVVDYGGSAADQPKKKIKAREFVEDLRGGMDDEALMEKYALTPQQFHKLLRMTVDSGLINADDLSSRISHT